ncbi:MAG TPA: YggS family pyridoxal phosphate-dependent enzyme [Silvibacterium sp.]|nr:YggS family pyridoxal phosphate-dependent enzyme [Silvibacterium sp.]
MTTFKHRLAAIEERIEAACNHAGRARREVQLIAVSKAHPASAIVEAIEAGVTLFGENRVQEFERKRSELEKLGVRIAAASPSAIVHLIGHLQSNKSAKAVEIFSAIDTLDSRRLAERLNEAAGKLGRTLPVLIEIKLSNEPAKTGLDPAGRELEEILDRAPDLLHLDVRGLMTVPPFDDNPETARSCFRRLRELRDELARQHPKLDFAELSMGMSGDFEIAIEEGSTQVRIGTALFGAREAQA